MQQLLFVIAVGYVCVRCLACGVQGQLRECAAEGPGCLDVELRLQFEPRRPRARDSFDRLEPGPWVEESWKLAHRGEPREQVPYQARKRPRNLQLAMQSPARFP
jgi:hypothetical protein